MAVFTMSINPPSVGHQTMVTVILPAFDRNDLNYKPGEKFQTLWLLHGGGGDHTDYIRKTSIERYALRHRLAVVCPEVGNSFYSDLPTNRGEQYYTYVSKELPEMLRLYLPLSEKREDNFIVGLSMGGFGASKIAFNNPEKYAAVGLMSTGPMSPLQLNEIMAKGPMGGNASRFERIFEGGLDSVPGSINDIWHVIEQGIKNGVDLPRIFNCCGTEDFTWPGFIGFKDFADSIGLDVTFGEGPGGHTWDFWDEWLPKIIDWLPLKRKNEGFI